MSNASESSIEQIEVKLCGAHGGSLDPDARCQFPAGHAEPYHSSDGSHPLDEDTRGYYWVPEADARLRLEPKPDADAKSALKIRLDDKGVFDELVGRGFIHIERMDESAFWIGIDPESGPSVSVRTGFEDGKWFFRVEEDAENGRDFAIESAQPKPDAEEKQIGKLYTVPLEGGGLEYTDGLPLAEESEDITLPMQYEETGKHNAEKGEQYAEQIIRKGYPKESRDVIATLSAIIFALDEKLTASAQPKPDVAGELLPCPMCGGKDIRESYVETYSVDSSYETFGCANCGLCFTDGDAPATREAWNKRVLSAPRNPDLAVAAQAMAEALEKVERDDGGFCPSCGIKGEHEKTCALHKALKLYREARNG